MKKEIIDSLTGIRGIAAIYVVIYHLFHHASDNNFINNGYLSVDLFFILSGFIITHAHRNDFFDVVTKKKKKLYHFYVIASYEDMASIRILVVIQHCYNCIKRSTYII
ncbi:TPA: acyltransferase family protein [Klebsiella pneumoniae]